MSLSTEHLAKTSNRSTVLGGDDAAEDYSHRVFGPVSIASELREFVHMLDNYVDAQMSLFRRYGDVVRTRLPYRGVFFFRPRHVKHILRTNVLNYTKSRDYDMLRPLLGQGIFVSEGELWTRQRRLLAPEFREKAVGRFVPQMVESAEQLFAEWDGRLGEGPIDITHDMMRLTLWVIARAMFKSEFLEDAEKIGHSLEICLAHATLQMQAMGLYKDWLPTRGNREAKHAEKQLNEIVARIIRHARANRSDGFDVLSRMMQAKDAETGATMSDQQLMDETKSLILAGHETTSLVLSWALYLLDRHPDIKARAAEEATRVLGNHTPTAEDVAKLDYTRMVFFETMRLYPPVPAVSRNVVQDDVVDGVRLKAGEIALVSPYVTHRHPEYWSDPERFDPERFAPGRVDQIEPFSYFPFLLGRRACLGEHFAMVEGVLMLAMLLQRYDFARTTEEPMQTRPISTLRLARPLMMRVTRRGA